MITSRVEALKGRLLGLSAHFFLALHLLTHSATPTHPPHHCPYKQPALTVPILKLQIATTKVCEATDRAAQRLLT